MARSAREEKDERFEQPGVGFGTDSRGVSVGPSDRANEGRWTTESRPEFPRGNQARSRDTPNIPEDQITRRAELQQAIDLRIDDLIHGMTTARSLRDGAAAYKGNWRDVVLFVCVALFTLIWWNVPHTRTNWLLTFIVMTLVALVTAAYAFRGTMRTLRATIRRRNRQSSPST